MARVLIVDDHPLMRKGMAMTIDEEMDLEVCGQAASAEEALDMLDSIVPDVAVVDISLPGMSGLELIKHLKVIQPDLKVLVVSRHDEALYAERALRSGARGYIMKLDAGDNIVLAVRKVLRGGVYVSEGISDRMLMNLAGGREAVTQSPLDVLSDRELEVFEMTGKGSSTREIAENLHLSVKTIESYKTRIKEKLHLENAADMMRHAVQWVTEDRPGQ